MIQGRWQVIRTIPGIPDITKAVVIRYRQEGTRGAGGQLAEVVAEEYSAQNSK